VSPLLPRKDGPWELEHAGSAGDAPEPPRMPDEQLQPEEVPPDTFPAAAAAAEARDPEGEAAPVPELSEVDVPAELEAQIRAAMERYPQRRSASIPALWAVQRRYGWCSPEGIRQAAAVMGLTPGYLQSIASFYDLFHLEPRADHQVLVCTNISCWLRGADRLLEDFCETAGTRPGESSEDGKVFVRAFECLGACDIAPMASIDERYYGPLEGEDAAAAIEQLRTGGEVLPGKRLQDRKAAGEGAS